MAVNNACGILVLQVVINLYLSLGLLPGTINIFRSSIDIHSTRSAVVQAQKALDSYRMVNASLGFAGAQSNFANENSFGSSTPYNLQLLNRKIDLANKAFAVTVQKIAPSSTYPSAVLDVPLNAELVISKMDPNMTTILKENAYLVYDSTFVINNGNQNLYRPNVSPNL